MHSPRSRLRIALFKESEESVIGEMLQSRRVVRHAVLVPWEVGHQGAVSVPPLVGARESAQVGCGAVRGHRPFLEPSDGRRVVRESFDGGESHVYRVRDQGQLPEDAGLFQVAYTPPIPALAASVAPSTLGFSGTISARCVGREHRLAASLANSLRCSRRYLSIRTRFFPALVRASWSTLKRPADPGMAQDTKRSLPSEAAARGCVVSCR